jgi:lipopolysaccharide export system permease protein
MTILDRMLFVSFLRAYFICLVSTLSLYIVVDLFTNIDDFFKPDRSSLQILSHILTYYGLRSIQYYDRLCEAISLLASMFTVAWTQRSNELIPMLSAGVSTHRFLRPIFFGATMMLGLGIVNQELVIPRVGNYLVSDRDDPDGAKDLHVHGYYDPNKIFIDGFKADRKSMTVEKFYVTLPETPQCRMAHISADKAQYIAKIPDVSRSGGWLLTGAHPAELPENSYDPALIEEIDPGRYFVWVREANFVAVTRGLKTQTFSSTSTLFNLMQRTDVGRMNQIAVTFHMRITRPIVGMLLVIMGLSIILRDQTRHVFISAGLCLAMCALFFAVVFGSKYMGNADYLSPALAAWLPVLIFGPVSFALYDAIHT